MPLDPGDSLDIASLAARYAAGSLDPLDVVEAIDARCATFPDPAVWIHRLPLASLREQAHAVSLRRRQGESLPLFGIPFAVKDNINVAGLPTTAGCPAFAYTPSTSATVVERLVRAGAIVVGKANLDQFATGLVGVRSPYGACRSVFDSRYISGGSSSGSAVAVAAGLVSFALGTDTAGSGRVPAAFNNIVGLKPTRGRLSTFGVVPACRSLDCVSIFALTCEDARRVAQVADGPDAADPYSRSPAEWGSAPAFNAAAFRFGVPAAGQLQFFGNAEGESLFRQAADRLTAIGGTAVTIDFEPFAAAARLLYQGPWVAERLAGIKDFFAKNPDALLPVTRAIIGGATKIDAVATFEGMYALQRLRRAADAQMARVDLLLLPTAGTTYTVAEVEADPIALNTNLGYYTNFVNLLDLSAVAVPGGFQKNHLPFGVTLLGRAGEDVVLLEIGGRLHNAGGMRLGATATPTPTPPPSKRPPLMPETPAAVSIAVVGAHLSGQPLNHQLTDLGGTLQRTAHTVRRYRLFALPGTVPPKPGLVRVADETETGIELEVWGLTAQAFGAFVAAIPPPLGVGTIELDDGTFVKGFLCESYAISRARDITHTGGWRRFLSTLP